MLKIKKVKWVMFISMLSVVFLFSYGGGKTYADSVAVSKVSQLTSQAEAEKASLGYVQESTLNALKDAINSTGIETDTDKYVNEAIPLSSSKWIDAGSGYKWRLDGPERNGNPKYHVHVRKNNSTTDVSAQNCDGEPSHGKTLNNLPKKVKESIENSQKYKSAETKQKKLNTALNKVESKDLNTSNTADLIIAIGIIVVAIGIAIFSAGSLSAWAAWFLIAI